MKTAILIGTAVCVLLIASILYALSIPVVQFSWETRDCVAVLYSDVHTCENLPTRYEREWVK